ncbi:hypothetical protein RB3260 [Rhodopirellula baltica SH 1]|uniref:Uncharacterized protein n=1 Tax=Rhodopirellula baltica (strain DSM 10527 / NCIMB 13988 / SH1) TaxID=243090 RepID=Q7UUJ2_RHOBA|nr:hypothetical protein RB3260 [Rhodopirellula baltica SH 1]
MGKRSRRRENARPALRVLGACDRWEVLSSNFRLGRKTEGFYDTAVTEAVEFESQEIVPMPTHVAYQRRCTEGLA